MTDPINELPVKPDERTDRSVSISISVPKDQFWSTVPVYATFPMVSFDGANMHIALLATAPSPLPDEDDEAAPVSVSARIVMPLESAEALANAILDAVNEPKPAGPFRDLFAAGKREEAE